MKYNKFEKVLQKIENLIIGITFTLIFITVFEQVVQRFFHLPIPDTSEISLVCLAVFTFFCVGKLTYSSEHITIEVQKLIKNKNLLFVVDIIAHLFNLLFSAIFLWLGYDLLTFTFASGTATTALRIPLWIPYGSMLCGIIFLVIHTIGAIWKMFYYKKNNLRFEDNDTNIEDLR